MEPFACFWFIGNLTNCMKAARTQSFGILISVFHWYWMCTIKETRIPRVHFCQDPSRDRRNLSYYVTKSGKTWTLCKRLKGSGSGIGMRFGVLLVSTGWKSLFSWDRYLLLPGLLFSHLFCDLAALLRTQPALGLMTSLSNSLFFIPVSQLHLTRVLMGTDKARQRMCKGAHFRLFAPGERWKGGGVGGGPDGTEVWDMKQLYSPPAANKAIRSPFQLMGL